MQADGNFASRLVGEILVPGLLKNRVVFLVKNRLNQNFNNELFCLFKSSLSHNEFLLRNSSIFVFKMYFQFIFNLVFNHFCGLLMLISGNYKQKLTRYQLKSFSSSWNELSCSLIVTFLHYYYYRDSWFIQSLTLTFISHWVIQPPPFMCLVTSCRCVELFFKD